MKSSSFNMLPRLSINNLMDRRYSYSKFLGQLGTVTPDLVINAKNKIISYIAHLKFGQLNVPGLFPPQIWRSSFFVSVSSVLGLRRKKQMCRVNTDRNITSVTDANAVVSAPPRNRAVGQFPRNSMGGGVPAPKFHPAVSERICAGIPNPAGISFSDLIPKPFFWTHLSGVA